MPNEILPVPKPYPARRAYPRTPPFALTIAWLAGPEAEPDADVPLIRLGRQFLTSWAHERAICAALGREKAIHRARERTKRIVREIEAMTAISLAGLKIKALALCWSRDGEPLQLAAFYDADATEARLAASIVNDLLAMSGL